MKGAVVVFSIHVHVPMPYICNPLQGWLMANTPPPPPPPEHVAAGQQQQQPHLEFKLLAHTHTHFSLFIASSSPATHLSAVVSRASQNEG